jgi:histidinol-phosphate/aromatic aminotransferase/cobyric acid decarboxylase-like protein
MTQHKKEDPNMAETVDELTIEYVEDGVTTVKQLDKIVLTKGAWATLLFRCQDWNRTKQCYGEDKYVIRRYQKRNGEYQLKSKFSISSKDQAQQLIDALNKWIK